MSDCTGCGACASSCNGNSLTMQPDSEGFLYPVTTDTCNDCNRCQKACPLVTLPPFHPAVQTVRAAWLNDGQARQNSSSGGFFRVLAQFVLERGGVVFGAAFDADMNLRHRSAESEKDCAAFSGSKYLQSDTATTYRDAKTALAANRWVLYSGTPCQIAGLYSFLGGDHPQLVTCDLVCNGVPSPAVFAATLRQLETKYGSKAVDVRFKDKSKGWHKPHFTVTFANGKRYSKPIGDTAYGHGFGAALFLRPACGTCPYARPERVADFTLGDFWGLRDPLPEGASHGVSLVLANSEKAAGLPLPPVYSYIERPFAEAAAGNGRLTHSLRHNPKRAAFFHAFTTQPFNRVPMQPALPYRLAAKLTPRWVKRLLGR